MARLGLEAIAALAVAGGLTSPDAVAIACAISGWNGSPDSGESGGDPAARGDTTITTNKWGPSIGLWQVRSLKAEQGTGGTRDENKLTDPTFNARSMFEISGGGSNWQPWSVYTSGKYRANMDAASKHVESIADGSGTYGDTSGGDGGGGGWRDRIISAAGFTLGPAGALVGPAGEIIGSGADIAGGVVGAVPGLDTLGQLGNIAGTAFGLLSDPSFWRRVGLVIVGLVLLAFAGGLLSKDLLGKEVGKIVGGATGGKLDAVAKVAEAASE